MVFFIKKKLVILNLLNVSCFEHNENKLLKWAWFFSSNELKVANVHW